MSGYSVGPPPPQGYGRVPPSTTSQGQPIRGNGWRWDIKHPEDSWRQILLGQHPQSYADLMAQMPSYSQLSAQGPQWGDILGRGYDGSGAPDMNALAGMGVNENTLGPGFSAQDARAWGIDPQELLQHFGVGAQIGQGNLAYKQMTASPTFALNQAAAGQAENALLQNLQRTMGGGYGANAAIAAATRSAGSRLRMQNRAGVYDSAMKQGADTVQGMMAPWAQSRMAGQQGLMEQVIARMKAASEGRMNTQNLAGQVGMQSQRLRADSAENARSLWADALNKARDLGANSQWNAANWANQNQNEAFQNWMKYFSQLSSQKAGKPSTASQIGGALSGAVQTGAAVYGATRKQK